MIIIPLETSAIFFLAILFLKQGISSEYVMVDFSCFGILDLFGTRTEHYKMKNSCPQWESNPGPSAYENVSYVSPACRKRRLTGAVCLNHCIKRLVPCGAWTGTSKNPAKCLWRWEPDRRSNFFSSPAHLCAVTYMTEISLIVTLNNQVNSTQRGELAKRCATS